MLLRKHPDREDVFVIPYKKLAESGKLLETIVMDEMPPDKQVFIHHDVSLRAYWVTTDPYFTPFAIDLGG